MSSGSSAGKYSRSGSRYSSGYYGIHADDVAITAYAAGKAGTGDTVSAVSEDTGSGASGADNEIGSHGSGSVEVRTGHDGSAESRVPGKGDDVRSHHVTSVHHEWTAGESYGEV